MLGSLRLLLAIFVTFGHLGAWQFADSFGIHAVFGFYVISGYLMTLVLRDIYQFQPAPYFLNRFLRLFPIYYAIALATLVAILVLPNAANYHEAWSIQTRPADIIGNLLMFPFEFYDHAFRLVPPTWSVAVEIVNYALLWLVVARSPWLGLATLAGAAAFHVYSLAIGDPWQARYFPFYAALLPFAIGSCLYYLVGRMAKKPRAALTALMAGLWLINLFMPGAFDWTAQQRNIFFYLNLALISALILLIAASPIKLPFDKWLGDLSYPLFLAHWFAGFIIARVVLPGEPFGDRLYFYALPLALALSIVLAWASNKLIEPLRDGVRGATRRAGAGVVNVTAVETSG